jgi:hypothetical protein
MENNKNRNHKSVFGICKSRYEVDSVVNDLLNGGFNNNDISVLLPSKEETKNFAHEKATKAPEGAASGAAGGAVVGGTLGWLAGIGLLAIPGVGPFVAAGPIVASIAGLGLGGAIGGLTGALVGMGIPEYEAKRYEDIVKNGGILLSVHVDDDAWTDRAKKILEQWNVQDVSVVSEKSSSPDFKKSNPNDLPYKRTPNDGRRM